MSVAYKSTKILFNNNLNTNNISNNDLDELNNNSNKKYWVKYNECKLFNTAIKELSQMEHDEKELLKDFLNK